MASTERQPEIDLAQAAAFLNAIDPERERWNFRTFPNSGQPGHGQFHYGTLAEVSAGLIAENNCGLGVFVVINDGGQDAHEIDRIVAAYGDFDDVPLPETFEIEPHVIVQSGPDGWHAYWLVDGLAVDEFKSTQRAIVARYGTDKCVIDPSRVMRLPGFLHTKGKPFQTRLVSTSGGLPYPASKLREVFPLTLSTPAANPTRFQLGSRADGATVTENRHGDLLKLSGKFARMVAFDGLSKASAMAALNTEADGQRWTREVPLQEREAALDGALAKLASGAWPAPNAGDEALQGSSPGGGDLRAVDMGRLASGEFKAPTFVARPLIPRGVVTLLGGHGGSGKSMLALIWAAFAASGAVWYGIYFEPSVVAFFSMEDDEDVILSRLRKIVEIFDLDQDKIIQNLRVFDGAHIDAALVAEEQGTRRIRATPMLAKLEAAASDAGFIVVDNASDTFDGDENSRRHVRGFIRLLSRIARKNMAGFLLLAHIDKSAAIHGGRGNSYSGSTAWHNSARSRLALTPKAGSDDLLLVHEKANYSGVFHAITLTKAECGVFVPDFRTPAEAFDAQEEGRKADDVAVLQAIKAANDADWVIPTTLAGPATAIHALSARSELSKQLRNKAGKARVKDALMRLEADAKIVRVAYRTPTRNSREKWVVAEAVDLSSFVDPPPHPLA